MFLKYNKWAATHCATFSSNAP